MSQPFSRSPASVLFLASLGFSPPFFFSHNLFGDSLSQVQILPPRQFCKLKKSCEKPKSGQSGFGFLFFQASVQPDRGFFIAPLKTGVVMKWEQKGEKDSLKNSTSTSKSRELTSGLTGMDIEAKRCGVCGAEAFESAMQIVLCFAIFLALCILSMLFSGFAEASEMKSALIGKATWYTVHSTLAEGNPGTITASGKRFDESAMTCAIRSRDFGKRYRVTSTESGKTLVCEHTDYGPGKGPASRGIVIDLTPAAYDALGGKRGVTAKGIAWGEIPVKVAAA